MSSDKATKRRSTKISDDLVLSQLFDSGTPLSGFQRVSEERFNAFALWGLSESFRRDFSITSYWAADGERLLAAIFHHTKSFKFGCAFFVRDSEGRFRELGHFGPWPTARAVEDALRTKAGTQVLKRQHELSPAKNIRPGMDLFVSIPSITKLHPAFRVLRDGARQAAARTMLEEIARWLPDRDGNFVRDFQTTGYSARIWEIYLFAAMRSLNFTVDLEQAVPDLCLTRGDEKVFIEAVTVNSDDTYASAMGEGPPPPAPKDFWQYIENEMPVKFGSPLFSKMQKKYWESSPVKGHPFVLAIADFHSPASMVWSHTAIPIYLFGRSAIVHLDESGVRRGTEKRVQIFHGKKKTINLPFFEQAGTENISAVLFSNAGTISKFNRMGVRAGFGDRFVKLVRRGGLSDPSPDAFDAIPFRLDVESSSYFEDWADELEMYHNPKALFPVREELFPNIVHFRIENDEEIWRGPPHRVLFSFTQTIDYLRRRIPGQKRNPTKPKTKRQARK